MRDQSRKTAGAFPVPHARCHMDIATILGLAAGLILVGTAMLFGGDAVPYVHFPSLLIIFGGTLSAVLIHFPARRVLSAFAVARNCFVTTLPEPIDVLGWFRGYAVTMRRSGVLGLETAAAQETDPFLKLGLELTAGGCSIETLRSALQRELYTINQRHQSGQRLFEVMAAAAPAWGVIGSLIGLVRMLSHLDDPRQIGSGLAVALLTTLYGALFASLICIPLAGKLESRHAEEIAIRELMTDGLLALLEEQSPGMIEDRLQTWLPPKQRAASARAA